MTLEKIVCLQTVNLLKCSKLKLSFTDTTQYRPVYAPKDFLEVVLHLKHTTCKETLDDPEWEFSFLPLQVKDLDQLVIKYQVALLIQFKIVPILSESIICPICERRTNFR